MSMTRNCPSYCRKSNPRPAPARRGPARAARESSAWSADNAPPAQVLHPLFPAQPDSRRKSA